jgi:oligopeptide transport system substrate-binding protein
MRLARWKSVVTVSMSIALAATVSGCGGGSESAGGGDAANAEVTIFSTEPENPLVPGNTTEVGGSRVLDAMFTGLVEYDVKDAKPVNAMAESITNKDAKVWTITLKKGWKFHDGTEVKAKNFVDAWNWTAYGPNATQGGSFFEQITGYADVAPEDPDGPTGPQQAPTPTTKEMSGLKVTGDYSFEVTFDEPFAVFPTKIGYEVYSPLPDAFFADQKKFEEHPIGNGPFKYVSRKVNSEIRLTRNDEYQGSDKAKFKDLTLKIYESRESAYADLVKGNLDFMEELPPNALAGGVYKGDLGDRIVQRPTLNNQTITFPYYSKPYDNVDLHKAISLAINRDEITKTIFEGTRTPADGFVHPLIQGYQPGACAEFCKFDPAKAKEYLTKSGFTGKLELRSNTDGGHQEWAEAVCNSIKNAIGVECVFVPVTSFAEHRKKVNAHTMESMYRAGWVADYPHIENWLNPIFRTGASSNDGLYSNPAVDAKLAEADAATSEQQAIALYREAEKLIAQDMPSVPLWTQNTIGGRSAKLKFAQLDPFRELDLASLELA